MCTIKCSKQEIRNGLAEYFRNTADFRRKKAEQYPHDTRNAKSAEALDRVAAYCHTLSDDDDQLARLCAMSRCFFEGGIFIPPCVDDIRQCDNIAAGCGFHGEIDPVKFLVEWIDAAELDYPEYVRRMDDYAGIENSGD